ncbi:cell wall metabolism sensor histidine kinase WalK [Nocardioides sp.]|uniref:sensor histidine kinase n=1 Tax=Nocardioides sp. TaxID=35761 RepID=UPI002715754C|nr:HAMP domain-containing sensor histidine kinase [Nocardioides sp.]MDO9458317.1 HAMP domain-containing sensor histidine kinase [Nocardioides sp.]
MASPTGLAVVALVLLLAAVSLWALRVTRALERARGTAVELVAVPEVADLTVLDSNEGGAQFLTTVSHELRTPLTSVIGYLELLEERFVAAAADDTDIRLLSVISRNADVLLARINQLLYLSPGGHVALDRRPVDVSALTREALDKHRILAQRHGIDLVARFDPALVSVVDATAYEQVVDNLVSNAIKYCGDDGVVTVALEGRQEPVDGRGVVPVVVLCVTDTGIGMSEAELQRAFDRFYRSSFATDRSIPGLGIGLTITQHLVQQHGGAITLLSEPGVGTEVTVVLPAHVAGRSVEAALPPDRTREPDLLG